MSLGLLLFISSSLTLSRSSGADTSDHCWNQCPLLASRTVPTSASSETPSASLASHRWARTPLIASHLMGPRCWPNDKDALWHTDTDQITKGGKLEKKKKDESSCLNIFPPPPYFSFSSLPSSPSSFPPFLLARGRTCGQREPGSLSPLLTLQGRRWRKALSWADCFPRAQGSSLLATCSPPSIHPCP